MTALKRNSSPWRSARTELKRKWILALRTSVHLCGNSCKQPKYLVSVNTVGTHRPPKLRGGPLPIDCMPQGLCALLLRWIYCSVCALRCPSWLGPSRPVPCLLSSISKLRLCCFLSRGFFFSQLHVLPGLMDFVCSLHF